MIFVMDYESAALQSFHAFTLVVRDRHKERMWQSFFELILTYCRDQGSCTLRERMQGREEEERASRKITFLQKLFFVVQPPRSPLWFAYVVGKAEDKNQEKVRLIYAGRMCGELRRE